MTIINVVNGKSYKQIESEEEYREQEKIFDRKLKQFENIRYTLSHFKEFNDFWDWTEGVGILDKEFCDSVRLRISEGVNNPSIRAKIKALINRKKK